MFYINEDYKFVILFDEYEVVFGYMGVIEFKILISVILSLFVGDCYV